MPCHAVYSAVIKSLPVSRVEGVSQTITKPPRNDSPTIKKICHFPVKNGPPNFHRRDTFDEVLTKLHWGSPDPLSKICHTPQKNLVIRSQKPHRFLRRNHTHSTPGVGGFRLRLTPSTQVEKNLLRIIRREIGMAWHGSTGSMPWARKNAPTRAPRAS